MSKNKIVNNPAALDEMLADLLAYDGDLGPGPYWAVNQKATLKRLGRDRLPHLAECFPQLAYLQL